MRADRDNLLFLQYNVKEVITEALVVGLTPSTDPGMEQCCRIL